MRRGSIRCGASTAQLEQGPRIILYESSSTEEDHQQPRAMDLSRNKTLAGGVLPPRSGRIYTANENPSGSASPTRIDASSSLSDRLSRTSCTEWEGAFSCSNNDRIRPRVASPRSRYRSSVFLPHCVRQKITLPAFLSNHSDLSWQIRSRDVWIRSAGRIPSRFA